MFKFFLGVVVTLIAVGAYLHTIKIPEYILIEAECVQGPEVRKPLTI